jgi:D-xylose transport system permease protein
MSNKTPSNSDSKAAPNPPVVNALLASQEQKSVRDFLASYLLRVRAGDFGILPIIIGLIGIAIFFQSQNQNFLTPQNFVNLILQMSGLTIIGFGLVFVLLLGEIDLSVGYVSGVGGVLVTVLLSNRFNVPWYLAISAALLATLLIGMLHGFLITFFQLPSFIVTVAGLLAWNGVVLVLVGDGGTIRIEDPLVRNLAGTYLPAALAWILGIGLVVGYAVLKYLRLQGRKKLGLAITPIPIVVAQVALLAILVFVTVAVANADVTERRVRGIPVIGALMIILMIVLTFVAENTRFGRYVLAVGGNKEAARRAGIRVERIRLYVFMLCSLMAGLGGIILASRLQSVSASTGGGQLLLNAIATAVIGGTSLFGGRGKVYTALLGALVIASLESGLGLLNIPSSLQYIITGIVLLLAVILDSISRRNQKRSGLA